MYDSKNFKTFKQRGEWVELQFMAAAAEHGYHVLKPCGDSLEYDVAVEHAGDVMRIQVKSSSARKAMAISAASATAALQNSATMLRQSTCSPST